MVRAATRSDAQTAPVTIPRFRAAAAPEAVPAPAVGGGATLVVVPTPARYALHELLVSQTRSLPQQTKATKDIHQAALLLEVLVEDRPDDLREACAAFRACGPAVTTKVQRAAATAAKRWPAAAAATGEIVRRLAATTRRRG